MKKYALVVIGVMAVSAMHAKYIKFENNYIALQSQFGLCGLFTLEPLMDLSGYEIKLRAEQWKQDQFVKKELGSTMYKPGHVYNFGSGKNYRVYCSMKVPQGYNPQFSTSGIQFVSETNSNTGNQASVTVDVNIAGSNQTYVFKDVPCNKIFKFGSRTSMERSCLSPLAPENPGTRELGMKN